MLNLALDWRMLARWGTLPDVLLPIAGDHPTSARPVSRYVLRLGCQHCDAHFLAAAPVTVSQACPDCGGVLRRLDTWDMCTEGHPAWWETEVP
jgi:hypothetical protein